MRIARIRHDGGASYARLHEGHAELYDRAPWAGGTLTGATAEIESLMAPVEPSKIVCVGRNYAAHAAELGHAVPAEPLLFLKPPSALLDPGGTIAWPRASDRVDYEGEIAVVMGSRLSGASIAEASRAIFGLTCANDVTARDLQRKDVQFTRGKGFDTFCPVGPWIETEPGDLSRLEVRTTVDGEERQHGRSEQMIWGIAELLAYIAAIMTLEPGDLVLTGTPAGVGPLEPGQRVEVTVSGVGSLRSTMGPRLDA